MSRTESRPDGTYTEVEYPLFYAPLITLGAFLFVLSIPLGMYLMATKALLVGLAQVLLGVGWGFIALSKYRRIIYLGAIGFSLTATGYAVNLITDEGSIQTVFNVVAMVCFSIVALMMLVGVVANYFIRRHNAKVREGIRIEDVEVLLCYSVKITLSNGASKVVDLEPYLLGERYTVTRARFYQPKITKRGVEWPGGFVLTIGDVL